MRRAGPRIRLGAAAALGAAALAVLGGCGLGPGKGTKDTSLTVTLDFGEHTLLDTASPKTSGQETVMRLTERNATVTTRYGGGFIQSIDGRAGGRSGGRPVDWFYYVNGIEAPKGAADTPVYDGDRIWWDRHDWGATQRIPAVVGSFPEPFLHGRDGKRLPVLVECADLSSAACDAVVNTFTKLGVVAARNRVRASFVRDTLRVLVGPWVALRDDATVRRMEQGPQASGVYARPTADGKRITILHPDGSPARTLGAGTGLVAATANEDDPPIWVITGTDAAGIAAAAGALDESALHDRFALAIAGGRGLHVPQVTP